VHKIIIPLDNENSVEVIAGLASDKFSYWVKEIRIAVNSSSKYSLERHCAFYIISPEEDYPDYTAIPSFKSHFEEVNKLPVPAKDVNKENDRKVWNYYVNALRKIVKQKEQAWKIKKVSKPYIEKDPKGERKSYLDVFIDEEKVTKQFSDQLKDLFDPTSITSCTVTNNKAFVEFLTYTELHPVTLEKIKELGEEFFYNISDKGLTHFIEGEYVLRYSGADEKREVFSHIEDRLNKEYHIRIQINDQGICDINEDELPYLEKVVSDDFPSLLSIQRSSIMELMVSFEIDTRAMLAEAVNRIRSVLTNKGLDKARITQDVSKGMITIEVGAYISPIEFGDTVKFISSTSSFVPDGEKLLKEIQGLSISNKAYVIENASKEDSEETIRLLTAQYPKAKVYRRPTAYRFKVDVSPDMKQLREFKRLADFKGKSEFIIQSSTLRITPDNREDYNKQLERVKEAGKGKCVIEDKAFKPAYKLVFENGLEHSHAFERVRQELQKHIPRKLHTEVIRQGTALLFRIDFSTPKEADEITTVLKSAEKGSEASLTLFLPAPHGRTAIEFTKNENLELENEKQVAKGVRQATFVFLTADQKAKYDKEKEEKGDHDKFKEGTTIGKLVRKEKAKLKFLLQDSFETLLHDREGDRLSIDEMVKGYIKPVFPGELSNIDRMIRAMRKVTDPGKKAGYPVNHNLCNFIFDPAEAKETVIDLESEYTRLRASLQETNLNNKQLEAVTKALHAKDLALIQGPPGTGKTTVIAELIRQTLNTDDSARILITSQTNLAVDNALGRLHGNDLIRPLRIGNIDKFEDEGKVYAHDRIKSWQFIPNPAEGSGNNENAVNIWIDRVVQRSGNDARYAVAIAKWKKGLNEKNELIRNTFTTAYLKNVNVLAATCSECGSKNFSETYSALFNESSKTDPSFDTVIMDEASKATPPELVLPLTLGNKVVIIGDHKQLPPMIDEREFGEALETIGAKDLIKDWERADFKISHFEKLFRNTPPSLRASLDTQYRMHEQIMNCISQFYQDQEELENGLVCGIREQMDIPDLKVKASRWHGLTLEPFINPSVHAIWVNTESPEIQENRHYYSNDGEIEAIDKVLKALEHTEGFNNYLDFIQSGRDEEKEIGLITFYGPQMKKLRDRFNGKSIGAGNGSKITCRINTVDKFQGMERDIVIISTVRSSKQLEVLNENGPRSEKENTSMGFAKETQRINVAFSRAKRLLIVVGNRRHFAKRPEYEEAIRKMHKVDITQLNNLIGQ
jgi:DNA polymerase III delta prime subunit